MKGYIYTFWEILAFIVNNWFIKEISTFTGNIFTTNLTSQEPDNSVKGNIVFENIFLELDFFFNTNRTIVLIILICPTGETSVTDDTRPPNAKDYVWPDVEDEGREGILIHNKLLEWSC